ncbi:MAG: carbohydrate porin, partial [Proteobacteria bacterium]|nr:carbohydrate porin [Pseudomonadota bacterium]
PFPNSFVSQNNKDSGPLRRGQITSLTHGLSFGPVLRVGIGRTQESASLFSTTASGAFGTMGDSDSTFVNFGGSVPLGNRLAAHASYTQVSSDILYAGDGYLSNWSAVRASAFSAGLTRQGLFRKEDNAGFAIYQPLRVSAAQADLRLPVGTEPVPGGAIHYQSERVDVTPTGREVDLQMAYSWKPTDVLNAATYGVVMMNPGHNNAAKTAYGAGVRLWLDF